MTHSKSTKIKKMKISVVAILVLCLGVLVFSNQTVWAANKNNNKASAQVESSRDLDLESLQELEQSLESEKEVAKPQDSLSSKENSSESEFPELDSSEFEIKKPIEKSLVAEAVLSEKSPQDRAEVNTVDSKESKIKEISPSMNSSVKSGFDSGSKIKNEIINLEFKMEGDVSRVFISSRAKLRYKEFKNRSMKQVVYVFENTSVPERLERAYDTSEFASPIALFTLLQVPQSKVPTAKLIIQLREDKIPSITNTETGMYVDFPSPDSLGESRVSLGDDRRKLIPEESNYSSNQEFFGKPIERLEIKNTDIQDVIRLIGRSSGYNIVIGEDVTGKVGSISLENIPWDQAFAIVLQSKKLGYVRQGNVLRVATLAALKAEKEEFIGVEQSKIKAEALRTVLIPVSYAKAQELAPKGKTLLSERGSLEVDERSNSIIVRDIDKVVGKLQKLYAILDTQPPIVSVSAKVVEMKSDFSRAFGMNALRLAQNTTGLNILDNNFDFTPNNTTISIKSSDFAKLEAKIGLAELEGETRVLANPSVSVNQNQKATFTQTLSAFYEVQQQAVAGQVPQKTLQGIDTTLSLEATPIVSGDGSISMTVNIKNEVPQKAGGGASVSIDKRSIQTQVLLENGDTAVIGGAFSSTASTSHNGVPGLMRLPLIGMLFSSKEIKETKNEILIFLTAKILNAEESFKRNF